MNPLHRFNKSRMENYRPSTPYHFTLIFTLIVFQILPSIQSTNLTTTSSPIPTTGTPGTILLPPSCSCIQTNIPFSQCEAFECSCSCDTTFHSCDWNCCCDEDCTQDEITRFSECLEESEQDAWAKMCFERKGELEDLNLKYPMRVDDSPEDALHGLLCVKIDNSYVKGTYYPNLGYPSASTVFQHHGIGRKSHDYNSNHLPTTISSSSSSSDGFELGDVISTFYKINDQWIKTNLKLPFPSDGGFCTNGNNIEFGTDVIKSKCFQGYDEDLELHCQYGGLNVNRYVHDLLVGIKENVVMSNEIDPFTDDQFTSITMNAYNDLDLSITTPPSTQWDATSSTCLYALQTLMYNIQYNTHGMITSITAKIETINVSSSVEKGFDQEFSAFFHPFKNVTTMAENPLKKKSGNPGYIFDAPILGAKLLSESNQSSYMDVYRQGLSVMDHGIGGSCETVSTTGTNVGFGEDMIVGCTHSMTRSELQNFCTSTSHPLLHKLTFGSETLYVPQWLRFDSNLLVGIFGNADPSDLNQWLRIHSVLEEDMSKSVSVKSRVWFPMEGRCEGIPTRLKLQFLWTFVGNVRRPQAKIISAQMEYDDTSYPLNHYLHPSQTQQFEFTTTVTWTYAKHDGDNSVVHPPPPNILFSVPDDVFYPFHIDRWTGGGNRIWTGCWFVVVNCLILWLML